MASRITLILLMALTAPVFAQKKAPSFSQWKKKKGIDKEEKDKEKVFRGKKKTPVQKINFQKIQGLYGKQCQTLLENTYSCTPSHCFAIDSNKVATKFEIGGMKNGYCTFFESIKWPPDMIKAISGVRDPVEVHNLSKTHFITYSCNIVDKYASALRMYLRWRIRGGVGERETCDYSIPDKKNASDEDLNCYLNWESRRFIDFYELGQIRGYCAKNDQIGLLKGRQRALDAQEN